LLIDATVFAVCRSMSVEIDRTQYVSFGGLEI